MRVQEWPSEAGFGSASVVLALTFMLTVAAPLAHGQTFNTIYNFAGTPDGQGPFAGVIQDSAGNLYGTTLTGGTACGYGSIFKITAKGAESLLYSYSGLDGELPYAGLLRDKAGNLYGTTYLGGASGLGTIFRLSKTGKLKVLHSFAGGGTDGCYPYGGVTMDSSGNIYGTTTLCGGGYGMLWKISKAGKMSVLHDFTGGATDGAEPALGNLFLDNKGNLYGVTIEGGPANAGVVYEVSKSGRFKMLYSFKAGTADGCFPYGTVARDGSGALYGTTNSCGAATLGTLWKLKGGKETVLHSFAGAPNDGRNPNAGVILDSKGNLYGTASGGGSSDDGVVYEYSGGEFTVLHAFAGSDGETADCGLLRTSKGKLYGTAYSGGSSGEGTVWTITP